MNPRKLSPTLRATLTAYVLMATLTASCAQTPPPAELPVPPAAAAQSQQVSAAKRIGEAIQSVDWSRTNEADARKTIEAAMVPFGMKFTYFELMEPTVQIPRRMSARIDSKHCPSPRDWIVGLGPPVRLVLARPHQLEQVTSPALIDRLIKGEERNFGSVSSLTFAPISNQIGYSFKMAGDGNCLNFAIVLPTPQSGDNQ
jgi:hypothetical protein